MSSTRNVNDHNQCVLFLAILIWWVEAQPLAGVS